MSLRNLGRTITILILFLSLDLHAAPILFTDRASWQAAVNGTLQLESFEVAVPNASITGQADYTDFSVSESNGANAINSQDSTEPTTITHGAATLAMKDNGSSLLNFFNFNNIFAFGFDITVIDSPNTTDITISGDINHNATLTKRVPSFFGILDASAPLSGLQIDAVGVPAVFVDYVEYSQDSASVPLPSSFALMGLLSGLLLYRFGKTPKSD